MTHPYRALRFPEISFGKGCFAIDSEKKGGVARKYHPFAAPEKSQTEKNPRKNQRTLVYCQNNEQGPWPIDGSQRRAEKVTGASHCHWINK